MWIHVIHDWIKKKATDLLSKLIDHFRTNLIQNNEKF